MKKRKPLIIFLAVGIAVVSLYAFWQLPTGQSNDARYKHYIKTIRFAIELRSISRQLPAFAAKPLNGLSNKSWDNIHDQERALFASGYLTNVSVTLRKASSKFRDTGKMPSFNVDDVDRLAYEAVPDNGWMPLSLKYNYESNLVSVVISCRTQDVASIQKAFENY